MVLGQQIEPENIIGLDRASMRTTADLAVVGAAASAASAANAVEAVAAVNRAITARLERHARKVATVAAGDLEHLAFHAWRAVETAARAPIGALAFTAALGTAGAAALGLAEAS